MKKLIFSKSNDHYFSGYRIETQILLDEETGEKVVCKRPLGAAAEPHIRDMARLSEELLEVLPRMRIAPCLQRQDGIEFPFFEGCTLLYAMLHVPGNAKEAYLSLWKEYFHRMTPAQPEASLFEKTSEYESFFGDSIPSGSIPAYPVSSFDMIPSNIMVEADGTWTLFDYEWRLAFPVPVELILFHAVATVHYFYPQVNDIADISEVLETMPKTVSAEQLNEARDHFLQKLGVNENCLYTMSDLYARYRKPQVDVYQMTHEVARLEREKQEIIDGWNREHAHALDIDRERMLLWEERSTWGDLDAWRKSGEEKLQHIYTLLLEKEQNRVQELEHEREELRAQLSVQAEKLHQSEETLQQQILRNAESSAAQELLQNMLAKAAGEKQDICDLLKACQQELAQEFEERRYVEKELTTLRKTLEHARREREGAEERLADLQQRLTNIEGTKMWKLVRRFVRHGTA